MRDKFPKREILLRSEQQRDMAIALIRNVPLDSEYPLLVSISEAPKKRKLTQNAAMWAGPLRDLAEQAYVRGRTYSEDVWNTHCKEEFLPESDDSDLDNLVTDPAHYEKWGWKPNGDRILIASSTDLTVHGMALYMEQIHALGASLGVQFSANPNERM